MGLNRFYRLLLLALLFTLSMGSALSSARASDRASDDVQFSFDFEDRSGAKSALHVEVETITVNAVDAAETLVESLSESTERTIVSSADSTLLEKAAKQGSRIALLPFGTAIKGTKDTVGGVNKLLRRMGENIRHAAKHDKVRLMLVTYSIGADAVRWLHVDTMSTFAQTSAILYMVVTNSIFSLNDEARARVTRPIENFWRKILRAGDVTEEGVPRARETLSAFLTNLSLASALNVGFITTLSIDKLVAKTFEASTLTVPLMLGIATTAAGFTWHEFATKIDEKTHPRAKKAARALLNGRIIVMSTLASSAMLLNHTQYGFSPWITLTAAGFIGLPLYFRADQLADWYENSRTIKAATRAYERVVNVFARKPVPACAALF
jgi:hypothetical protein